MHFKIYIFHLFIINIHKFTTTSQRIHFTYLICVAGHAGSLCGFCSDPVSLLFTSWQHKFMCHKVSCASINGNDLCHVRMMTTLGSLYDNTHRDWTDGATITSSPSSPSLCSAVNRNGAERKGLLTRALVMVWSGGLFMVWGMNVRRTGKLYWQNIQYVTTIMTIIRVEWFIETKWAK